MSRLVRSVLSSFGIKSIYEAHDSERGFELFREYKPDIVLIDWMMQPKDGLHLARKMRHDNFSPNKFVPIVIMTGFSQKHRVIKARDNGITEFLVKPFNARELYRRLSQVIENPRQFVRSEDYFGPDRRRLNDNRYDGPKRREDDAGESTDSNDNNEENKEVFEIDFG